VVGTKVRTEHRGDGLFHLKHRAAKVQRTRSGEGRARDLSLLGAKAKYGNPDKTEEVVSRAPTERVEKSPRPTKAGDRRTESGGKESPEKNGSSFYHRLRDGGTKRER